MKNILFLILIISAFNAFSQSNYTLKYADDLFENLEYVESSNVYNDILKKQEKKNELDSGVVCRAAMSNYYSRNYNQSFELFSLFVKKFQLNETTSRLFFDAALRSGNDVSSSFAHYKALNSISYEDYQSEIVNASLSETSFEVNDWQKNSSQGDYGVSIINDTLYFSTNRSDVGYTHRGYGWDNFNYSNIYFVVDTVVDHNKNINSVYHDGPLAYFNGKYYLTRTIKVKDQKKHVKVVVGNTNKDFEEFHLNNESYNIGQLFFFGETMYFSSDMPGGHGGSDIYSMEYENGKWTSPVNLKEINTSGDEMWPYVDENGKIYFSSNGHVGYGGLDVFVYNGESIVNLGKSFNSNQDDFNFYLKNPKHGYFSSDRKDNIDRIYSFNYLIKKGILKIDALEFKKKYRVESPNIYVINRNTNDTLLLAQNNDGFFYMNIDSGEDYIVIGKKEQYELHQPLYLNTEDLKNNDTILKPLLFDRLRYDMIVKTIVKGTDKIIPNVDVVFTHSVTGQKIHIQTDENGISNINIDEDTKYSVDARKKGYLDLFKLIETNSLMLLELDLELLEIKEDVVFKIENIYYDLDKATLRSESKVELDKLAEFLKLNDNIKVELSSHTDCRASRSYNQNLSQRRAESCVDYLIQMGIAKSQIVAKGYGEYKLVNDCGCEGNVKSDCSEEEHQQNRRTEIKILTVN